MLAYNLKNTTTGEDIFYPMNGFFEIREMELNNLEQISGDGCLGIMGRNIGFRIVFEGRKIGFHCFLHCSTLKTVLNGAVKRERLERSYF